MTIECCIKCTLSKDFIRLLMKANVYFNVLIVFYISCQASHFVNSGFQHCYAHIAYVYEHLCLFNMAFTFIVFSLFFYSPKLIFVSH